MYYAGQEEDDSALRLFSLEIDSLSCHECPFWEHEKLNVALTTQPQLVVYSYMRSGKWSPLCLEKR